MPHCIVRDDLPFCRIGDQFVFLDVDKDRYFRLPDALDRALASYLEGDGTVDVSGLLERNILVERPCKASGRRNIEPASRSAMEASRPAQKLRASELMEVLAVVLRTRLALKLLPLKRVLDGLAHSQGDADKQVPPMPTAPSTPLRERQLSEAAAVYRHARLYAPVDMRCLLDSIAMAKFLRRRRLHAHVVFGVALDPFSAHCWVQAGDLVLNDSVGNVNAHTPIWVV